jgi:hypothetical protein
MEIDQSQSDQCVTTFEYLIFRAAGLSMRKKKMLRKTLSVERLVRVGAG